MAKWKYKVNNKQIKWKLWRDKGINQIHDLLNETGEFLNVTDLEQKYNLKCDLLKYNMLKDAIPSKWRTLLKTMKIKQETVNFQEQIHLKIGKNIKPINTIKNNEIYWTLVNQIKVAPIIIEKYKKVLGI